ncbi:MAG: hypothetical protein AAF405_07615 [Pseudomonadota bacterium]
MVLTLRDPTGQTESAMRARAAPLATLDGKVIALMDIGKMRGDEFIDKLEMIYTAKGLAVRRFKKPTNTKVAPRELLDEIAATSDAVVVALSD